LSGHLAPMIGSTAEDQVKKLLEYLGYQILRENVIKPSIDKIIKYTGEPKPKLNNKCVLKEPKFSPKGNIAVSIKTGNFKDSDVTDLIKDIDEAKNHPDDYLLQNIDSGLIISNSLKKPSEIDSYKDRGIICWDISRLFFYASKVNIIKDMSESAPIKEVNLELNFYASYLRQWTFDKSKSNTINGRFIVLVDEHDSEFVYSTDHNSNVLNEIYKKEIKTMIEERDLNVFSSFEIHVLGKANEELVKSSYLDFSRENTKGNQKDIGARFRADLEIVQYSVSPWAALLK